MPMTNFANKRDSSRKFWWDVLDLFRIRKKSIHWGTVYDSRTKQPIDPAVVELLDLLTREVKQTAITDLWGRYGFFAEAGDYLIRVNRGNYTFPSKEVKGSKDGIYDNVYHGEEIPVRVKWDIISLNIPLDPVREDFNQQAKKEFARIYSKPEKLLQWVFNLLFWGGFGASAVFYFLDQGLTETIVLIFFILIFTLRILLPPRPLTGRIFSKKTGEPLGFVDIELKTPGAPGVLIAKTRSAPDGKFFLKATEGNFTLKITDPFTKQILLEGIVALGADGLLTSDIFV